MLSQYHPPKFTNKFFIIPTTDQPKETLNCPLPTSDKTLKDFFQTSDGAKYKEIFAQEMSKIIAFANAHHIPAERLTTFNRLHQTYAGHDEDANADRLPFYKEAPHLLHRYAELLANEKVPLHARQEAVRNFNLYANVCAPGTHTYLIGDCLKMESYLDLSKNFLFMRQLIATHHALTLVKRYDDDDELLDVHYVNALLNAHSETFGINTIEDPNIDRVDEDTLQRLLEKFHDMAPTIITPTHVLRHIVNEVDPENMASRCQSHPFGDVTAAVESALNAFGPEGARQFYDLRDTMVDDDEGHVSNNWRAEGLVFQSVRERLEQSGFLEQYSFSEEIAPNVSLYNFSSEDSESIHFAYVNAPALHNKPTHQSFKNFLVERLLEDNRETSVYRQFFNNKLSTPQQHYVVSLLCKACQMSGYTHPVTSPAKVLFELLPANKLAFAITSLTKAALNFYFHLIMQLDDVLYTFFQALIQANPSYKYITDQIAVTLDSFQADQFFLRYFQIVSQREGYTKEIAHHFFCFSIKHSLTKLTQEILSGNPIKININQPIIGIHNTTFYLKNAIECDEKATVELLLEAGAELTLTVNTSLHVYSFNAIDVAIEGEHYHALKAILSFAMKNNKTVMSDKQLIDMLEDHDDLPTYLVVTLSNYIIKNHLSISSDVQKNIFYELNDDANQLQILKQLVTLFPESAKAAVNYTNPPLLAQQAEDDDEGPFLQSTAFHDTLFSTYQETTGKKLIVDEYVKYTIKHRMLGCLNKFIPKFIGINDKLNESGATFLHLLAIHRDVNPTDTLGEDTLEFLNQFPALEVNVCDASGKTPLDYAKQRQDTVLVDELKRRGAVEKVVHARDDASDDSSSDSDEEDPSKSRYKRSRQNAAASRMFSDMQMDDAADIEAAKRQSPWF